MPGPVTGNEARSLAPLDYGSPPKSRINCAFYIGAFVSPPCSFPNTPQREKEREKKGRKEKRNKKKYRRKRKRKGEKIKKAIGELVD